MDDNRYDLIVVGAGVAGLVAANRAAERGLTVVVLEQGEDEQYLCNSRFTGGFFHIAMNSVTSPGDTLRSVIDDVTSGSADARLRDALVDGMGPALAWLKQRGVRFVRGGPLGWMSHVLSPPGLRRPGLHWQGRAGDVLLRDMAGWLESAGMQIRRGHRARSLIFNGERVAGLSAERADGRLVDFSGSVLLADGGFQGNPELVRQHISPRPDALLTRGAGTGRGDGLRLAQSVGAKLSGLESFYGHVQCREAISTSELWPYPVLDLVCAAGLVLDRDGRRFADEGLGGVHLSNAIARLDDPLAAVVIFDQAIWEGPGRDFILPPNPFAVEGGARLFASDTLRGLARDLELPPDTFEAAVNDYNNAISSGTLSSLSPPRSDGRFQPRPVKTAPFLAMRVCAGITYTMGGIHTDHVGRVLTETGQILAGLYAAGSTTGGLEGGPATGYTGGLSKAAAFGFAVGSTLAKTPALSGA